MQFTKSRVHGRYYAEGWSAKSGRKFTFTVDRDDSTPNASVRGGAYRTTWVCKHGDHKVRADTRKAAVAGVIAAMARKGIVIVFEAPEVQG